MKHPKRNLITRALGVEEELKVDFTEENTDFALRQELLSLAEKEGNHALWEELSAIARE